MGRSIKPYQSGAKTHNKAFAAERKKHAPAEKQRYLIKSKEKYMKYDFDLICIGLGPAGMAVSAMGAEMGLKVCAIEKNKVGGECMNVGCVPSKSLLRISKFRHSLSKLKEMGLMDGEIPDIKSPFSKIAGYLDY